MVVIIVLVAYLFLLFGIAYLGDKRAKQGKSLVKNPYVYALSLAVYCTAWTYFGSVGKAVKDGLDFILIYLGPVLFMPFWWAITRKMIRICRVHHISSLADFISSRYGKSFFLGGLVTIVSVLGVVPYISLQLKAITQGLAILTKESIQQPLYFYQDYAIYITLFMAVFTIYFGTRNIESTSRNEGLITAIAFESVFKLLAFLGIGIFVTYIAFDGVGDIFGLAVKQINLKQLFTFDGGDWFALMFLSMLAIMFLPRQFQVAVLENKNEKHLKKAIWLFPVYLLLINLFVLPIALGGNILLGDRFEADQYIMAIPLHLNQPVMAIVTYLGGFAAATSMIIVSSLALSVMLTNNILLPLALKIPSLNKYYNGRGANKLVLNARRFSILAILLLAYLYLHFIAGSFSLVSIGFISFVAVAQFAPAAIGGIYWRDATKMGAKVSILVGFGVWVYTLVLPNILEITGYTNWLQPESILYPYSLLGLKGLSPVAHAFFWSISMNLLTYVGVSLLSRQSSKEHNQAELFVDIFKNKLAYEETLAWKGFAEKKQLDNLLANFLGKARTDELFTHLAHRQPLQQQEHFDTAIWVNYAEKILAGAVGTVSARILVSSVVKEEEISQKDVVELLKETQTVKRLNVALKKLDQQKNNFISTVTHEMRTPLTSIRAFAEILQDNPTLEEDEKQHFLETIIKETERMNRLIDQVLELEKFESGKQTLQVASHPVQPIIEEALITMQQVFKERNIEVTLEADQAPPLMIDRDKMLQVFFNILSNAVKFTKAFIQVRIKNLQETILVEFEDNGKGIQREHQGYIFDKFYQTETQTSKKPQGSGLGLAICKNIIQLHRGKIWVESQPEKYTIFKILLQK
ncbi:MAG: ATP-binding protein [Thermonemataceae bacterium]